MNTFGESCPPELIENEAQVLIAQISAEEILYGKPGGFDFVRREDRYEGTQ